MARDDHSFCNGYLGLHAVPEGGTEWSDLVTIASIVSAGVYIANRFIAIVEASASLRASQPAIYRT